MMTETDHLVAVYLARVDQAAIRLPAGRREELVNDLREHIEIARAEAEGEETEASIRTILERLGDPESIVAAADTQTDLPRVTPAFAPQSAFAPPARTSRKPFWVTASVLAVTGVVFVFCLLALALARVDGSSEPAPARPAEPAVTTGTVPDPTLPTANPSRVP
ncbi:hypothetical protein SAMN04489716_4648 [Actinoplanes derwentensis]|uniref:Uncharacterized protein n=3 Tax=Actinoplanes derwentensis TaxID=113562 RepID=A0A1H2BK06_9ACTN|nr:hypothetical protein Ade03nite_93110 [Actinoplanes derwentensis]SDT58096.1 hypothetical protein SAMN04489716_4648 [Actinoplanes derwentensis]